MGGHNGDELRIYELRATGFAGFDSEPTLELPTLRKGAPDPAEWLQFCVYYFFIAFNCLTQEVPKGPNSPKTYLTPKELLVYQQKNRDLLNMRWTLH